MDLTAYFSLLPVCRKDQYHAANRGSSSRRRHEGGKGENDFRRIKEVFGMNREGGTWDIQQGRGRQTDRLWLHRHWRKINVHTSMQLDKDTRSCILVKSGCKSLEKLQQICKLKLKARLKKIQRMLNKSKNKRKTSWFQSYLEKEAGRGQCQVSDRRYDFPAPEEKRAKKNNFKTQFRKFSLCFYIKWNLLLSVMLFPYSMCILLHRWWLTFHKSKYFETVRQNMEF